MILILFLLLTLGWSSTLLAQAPFYQGKTITIVVGTKAGDVYDLYPRLLGEFWTKHIPGNPNIIVQNVPGAASLIAANQVYNIAKPDGLTLGAIYPALYFDQLMKRTEVKYDTAKWNWIGSTVTSNQLLYMRADTPYKSIDDVRKAATAPKCGSTGIASTGYFMPKLLEETIGAKFNVVLGYPGGPEMDLSVEKGETQCRAFTLSAFFGRREPYLTWRQKGFVRVLIQSGSKRDPRLPNVPTIYELMDEYKTPEPSRRLAKLILASGDLGRPIIGPPGMPGDRVNILRQAFMKALNDRELLTLAEKQGVEIEPTGGEELETLAREVMAQSPEVVEQMKKILGK